MGTAQHWNSVYASKAVDQVSWYQPHAETSLQLIEHLVPDRSANIIDVGAGASMLLDDLLGAGYSNLTVLDIAEQAFRVSRNRLGTRASQINWLVGDVTAAELPEAAFDVWHDRAVFHFLTGEADRKRYVDQVLRAVRPGGFVIVATFGPGGPLQCSNLDVCRYAPEELHGEFGVQFGLLGHHTELHQTPTGKTQEFVYCYCRRAE